MKMLDCLSYIGERLNKEEIKWAVGGSLLLYMYEIIDTPNDIDLLVHEEDVWRLKELFKTIGKEKAALSKKPFCTKEFLHFNVWGMEIDIMAGFGIEHDQGIYRLPFDRSSIVEIKAVIGVDVPLSALEDWYILYQLIPNKCEKAMLMEGYWKTNGMANPSLLRRALEQPLPLHIKEKAEDMLKIYDPAG